MTGQVGEKVFFLHHIYLLEYFSQVSEKETQPIMKFTFLTRLLLGSTNYSIHKRENGVYAGVFMWLR